ncbi:type I polyketide synthase [Tengunoibacter tsumagoiensis]|uniref:Uncharacterized protein n=1 Tax=Tengunoibacter tsumagoiensis TaxID=2014871 RepID=A0A402A948_9CHLR|nr:type I polyketide synthase [Tengunoibacter tsumagoiensis]GCE15704.1 hypothetical protein KTT_55630 [Tengunoibacter tsumagoiensis]
MNRTTLPENAIAIIGMSGRFPGARTIEEFWDNLQAGRESITFFSEEELRASGISPTLIAHPDYVPAKGTMDDIDLFDADFFGFTPKEAEITDPQQRIFLESCWNALENAGYDPYTFQDSIGVYAGSGGSTYLLVNIASRPDLLTAVNGFQLMIGNDKDFLATRVSYKLNLRGPSITIQTACSTSLVAVHLACESLLRGECDMALAGGVSISIPNQAGYLYQEGAFNSPDGHCRAFDSEGKGFVSGSGVGVVVLKRLEQAIEDGDHIYALLRGTAVNNDGALKVGYTAPSIEGQTQVISEALSIASVPPESIGYVEAHGTGTVLGDPIEISALTQAFHSEDEIRNYCAIGSVKTNVGHLGAAAGVTGLIKTVLSLTHKQIPPSLHFNQPNPQINFAQSPFYVNTTLKRWEQPAGPLRAGVSSLGIGGTNAHAILEEAPQDLPEAPDLDRPYHLLALSARTPEALERLSLNLATYCTGKSAAPLSSIAYTLHAGRHAFPYRRTIVCRDVQEAIQRLAPSSSQAAIAPAQNAYSRIVFLFPGGGAQYTHMARNLYQHEPFFRELVDLCSSLLAQSLQLDIRRILFPTTEQHDSATQQLMSSIIGQPALFIIEYALARLLMEWGIQPEALFGYSLGEYVAACLAGVLTLKEALALVGMRGKLIQQLPHGNMLAVALPEAEVYALVDAELSLAAVNGPSLCVLAGTPERIERLNKELSTRGVQTRLLHVSHAYHSSLLEPILQPFHDYVARLPLKSPSIPYLSSLTGRWITSEQATDPTYWTNHLRYTVRFPEAIQELFQQDGQVLFEVGPGNTLSILARQYQNAESAQQTILSTLRSPRQELLNDEEILLSALGKFWAGGGVIDWKAFYKGRTVRRTPLPTYPFDYQSYWVNYAAMVEDLRLPKEPAVAPIAPQSLLLQEDEEGDTRSQLEDDDLIRTICAVWQEVLGIPNIQPTNDFFSLGGNSVIATQLIARLRDLFPIELPLSVLFDASTVTALAGVIEDKLIESLETAPEERV